MYTYSDLMSKLQKKGTRKLENNTYARLEGDKIIITLHDSDIATLQPNKVTLTSAGWHTNTTKDRLNEIVPQPFKIFQDKKVWYVGRGWGEKVSTFYDGIEFIYRQDWGGEGWELINPKSDYSESKISNQALKYVNDFVTAFMRGEIDNPSGGDCWYCYMSTEDGKSLGDATNNDHILSHIEEKYYVPSLLYHALVDDNKKHICGLTEDGLARIWDDWKKVTTLDNWQRDIMKRDITSCLKRYVYSRLGLAF